MAVDVENATVLLTGENGEIWSWNINSDETALLVDTNLQFTDIAVAPDGQVYAITERELFRVDLLKGTTSLVGSLDAVLYAGHSGISKATGFDISLDGVARVSYSDNTVISEIDLATAAAVKINSSGDGYSGSPGDISFYPSTSIRYYYVSSLSSSVIAFGAVWQDGVRTEFDGISDSWFVGSDALTGMVRAPAGATGISTSISDYGLIGFDANHAYDLGDPGGVFGGLITTFAGMSNITGAALTSSIVERYIVGNAGSNSLYGNDDDDIMAGRSGGDWLFGGGGNDALHGGSGRDSLNGEAGDDTLNGDSGIDTLAGGGGNDRFLIESTSDVILEDFGAGTDTVEAPMSFTLGNNIENLIMYGSAVNGTGNGLDNRIDGNATSNFLIGGAGNDTLNGGDGNDKISGGSGADSMTGGDGSDTYYVDGAGDLVVEAANQGSDKIIATISYTLGDNVEKLELSGAPAVIGTGNALGNTISGTSYANLIQGLAGNDVLTGLGGNDTLDGGAGLDNMAGGSGSDTYIVNHAGDVVVELAGQGTDTVQSSVSWTLGANVEKLTLTGSGAVSGTGNELANTILGNVGANLLDGGLGNDTMNGGAGADGFRFSSALGAGNVDSVQSYSVTDDTIQLDDAIFTGLAAGALAAGAFVTGAAAADASDRIIYNSATGALSFDADGNGAGAAVQFATITNLAALTAADFLVV